MHYQNIYRRLGKKDLEKAKAQIVVINERPNDVMVKS